MYIYSICLNKQQASILMPSISPNILQNKGREESLETIFPNLKLLPRGGYWFDLITETETEAKNFISKFPQLFRLHKKRKQEDEILARIDLQNYNQQELAELLRNS